MPRLLDRDPRVPIAFRITTEALAEVDKLASKRGETRADTVRAMLGYALQHADKLPKGRKAQ